MRTRIRTLDRREFLREGGVLAASVWGGPHVLEALGAHRAAAPRIRFGYAAITWGGNDPQAID